MWDMAGTHGPVRCCPTFLTTRVCSIARSWSPFFYSINTNIICTYKHPVVRKTSHETYFNQILYYHWEIANTVTPTYTIWTVPDRTFAGIRIDMLYITMYLFVVYSLLPFGYLLSMFIILLVLLHSYSMLITWLVMLIFQLVTWESQFVTVLLAH